MTPASTVSAADFAPLTPGTVLADRYQFQATIGQGGSGTVVRAWDRVLAEPIAIKILLPARAKERSWIKRLAREVKVARAIRHPNVCRVFELGHAGEHWFVTMELASGGSLLRQLSRKEPRPLAERLEDARAVCAGLAAIHAVGIIHRDVTPQNVLRMADGRLVLSDFGLAIEAAAETTVHGGTPTYMPPETVRGQLSDQRSDVWQLGMIMHEILFGGRPEWHDVDGVMTMKSPLDHEASPVEEELERLCRDCLAHSPAARPPSAVAVAGRLAAAEVARPRTRTQRAWLRAKTLARRFRTLGFAMGALLVLGGVARGVQVAVRPPLCRASNQRLEGIWDAPTQAVARQAFATSGRSYAAETFTNVSRIIDGYLAAWAGMYQEACEATHVRGEQSPEVLDLRMGCLQDRLHGVRALSGLFSHATADVVDNAVNAAHALGTLERCADARLLRAMLPPPENEAARREVERIRRGVADVKALHDAGNEKLAKERLRPIVADARRVGYGPALAEALDLLGIVGVDDGDTVDGDGALKEAFWQAEASRHDEVKAEAATFLVITSGRRSRYRESDDWAQQADATLKRIGGHDRLRAWLETHVAVTRRAEGRNEEAIVHDTRAVALKERSHAGRVDIARNLGNISIALFFMGRNQEALDYAERSGADMRRELGPEHPLVAIFMSNKGEILSHLGRHAEARAAFANALAIEEGSFGKESANLAHPLQGLGDSYLLDHKPADAIAPLERALRLREAHESDRALVAETSFALARALAGAGQQHARARTLATRARDIYAQQPEHRAELEEVGRWMAAR